jgi:hypothetical protein
VMRKGKLLKKRKIVRNVCYIYQTTGVTSHETFFF